MDMFSDRKMARMDDLHGELEGAVPGSAEEREILERARARRGQAEDEITITRARDLLAAAPDERQVIKGGPAQGAAHVAIEHVTGEHQVAVGPAAGPEHLQGPQA